MHVVYRGMLGNVRRCLFSRIQIFSQMKPMRRLLMVLFGCMLTLAITSASSCKNKQAVQEPAPQNQTPEPPKSVESTLPAAPTPATPADDNYPYSQVKIHTKFGDMVVQLYDKTPLHKANFIKLVQEKYYDDLIFHRCIKNFMIQGGDPNSKGASLNQYLGTGGPGYTLPAEFKPEYIHKKGALCAARQGDQVNPKKESSGSQFYIVQGTKLNDMQLAQMEVYVAQKMPGFKYTEEQKNIYKTLGGTPQLDMDYTVFGEVISGINVLDSIAAQPTKPGDRPLENITMRMELTKN